MSGPVNVLAVMDRDARHAEAYWIAHGVIDGNPHQMVQESTASRAAVAELIAAATDLQEAMDEHDASPFDIGPSTRFIKADARHRAALAATGETK